MGLGITRFLSPNQGSDLLHGLKISYHNIFPHNKVSVHRISSPRYITYSCFRLAAVPVIRSPVSGGDEGEGEQAQADNVSEPIRFEAGRSRSGRPTTKYVL